MTIQDVQPYIDLIVEYSQIYSIKIAAALLIFFIGKRLAKLLSNMLVSVLERNEVEAELIGFLQSLSYWGLFAMVAVAALGQLGIQTASLIAVLGAAGLAVGLALQGSLSNFAAGVLIILLRPLKVDDWVDIAGESGKVRAIKIFTTELRTGDNKCVIIPNSRILDSNIVNHSSTGRRRVDLVFGISYDDNIDRAKEVIRSLLVEDERILDDPEPLIAVIELADSSVNIAARPWVSTDDYWPVRLELNEKVKKAFDAEGIVIPYPQSEVHVTKQ